MGVYIRWRNWSTGAALKKTRDNMPPLPEKRRIQRGEKNEKMKKQNEKKEGKQYSVRLSKYESEKLEKLRAGLQCSAAQLLRMLWRGALVDYTGLKIHEIKGKMSRHNKLETPLPENNTTL